jgi:hypothetical protein
LPTRTGPTRSAACWSPGTTACSRSSTTSCHTARCAPARRFRRYLVGAGIRTLAAATYPQAGPDDGRSLAIVLDAADGDERQVTGLWERLIADLEVENGKVEGCEPGDGSS